MSKAKKTLARVKFLEEITQTMANHQSLSTIVSRANVTEYYIQRALFLELQSRLPKLLEQSFGYSPRYCEKIARERFKWEQNVTTTVHNFSFMATNHRPDAVLDIKNHYRIAIEIKRGKDGSELRSGIGQSLVYSTQFDFVIYIFVDITSGYDIRNSVGAEKEKGLIDGLWEEYNIAFKVV